MKHPNQVQVPPMSGLKRNTNQSPMGLKFLGLFFGFCLLFLHPEVLKDLFFQQNMAVFKFRAQKMTHMVNNEMDAIRKREASYTLLGGSGPMTCKWLYEPCLRSPPKDRVVGPLPNGLYKWLINGGYSLTTYKSWDDPPSRINYG